MRTKIKILSTVVVLVLSIITLVGCSDWRKNDSAITSLKLDESRLPDYVSSKNVKDIYVDGNVKDNGIGNINSPFNNIDSALNLTKELNQVYNEFDTIRINISGNLEVENTIYIDSSHSSRYPLVIRGNEKSVINGGHSFKGGWSLYKDGIYSVSIEADDFRQLYVNGSSGIRARYPNKVENPIDSVRVGQWNQSSKNISIDKSFKGVLGQDTSKYNLNNLELFIVEYWTQYVIKMESITTNESGGLDIKFEDELEKLVFDRKRTGGSETPYVFMENDLALLDAENEWYYDSEDKKLYYKPNSGVDINTLEFTIPKDSIIEFDNFD